MPGTSNPVSSNPVPGVSHTRSFRNRLGFGGSGGSGSSIKPSFFSQLNLKSSRKSLAGSTEFAIHNRPVLIIDSGSGNGGMWQGNRMVLNDEAEPTPPRQSPIEPYSHSPSKETSSSRSRYSLPPSSIDTHTPLYVLNSREELGMIPVNGMVLESQVDPNGSGLSKHLPDLSADLSLLLNEPPPDTASQSDHYHEPQVSSMNASISNSAIHKGVTSAHAPFPGSFPATLESCDQSQRWNFQELAVAGNKLRPIACSPPGVSKDSLEPNESATRLTNAAAENASASFDLSSAKLSLDLMRQSVGDDWARSVVVESVSAPSADASALLIPSESPMLDSGSGPITSTPFLSPKASPSQNQRGDPEVSFDLDALDPDLVALLRPNNYNKRKPHMSRIVTPSPLEPFSPPPDPMNPGTTVQRPTSPPASSPTSSSSPSAPTKAEGATSPPVRKFATMSTSASPSPARQLRLPRSTTARDIIPASHALKPTSAPTSRVDLLWLETRTRDDGRPSPSSVPNSSDTGTPLDGSKQPSPLSAPPLTLNDLEREREQSPMQSSTTSSSTSNITTHHRAPALAQIQSPNPVSVLTSSTNSHPTPHYPSRNRDREFRTASASPEAPGSSTYTFGSLGRERERIRPPIEGLFPTRSGPETSIRHPNLAGGDGAGNAFHDRLNSNSVLTHARAREWETSRDRRYRKRSMSLDQSPSGFGGRDHLHLNEDVNPRFRRLGDRDRLAEPEGYSGREYVYSPTSGLSAPYDRDEDSHQGPLGYRYGCGDRERFGRPHTDWLGPRTAKAFAAAGLLDDPRDPPGSRHRGFSQSTSDRDLRTFGSGGSRERRSPVSSAFQSVEGERDREPLSSRYSFAASVRSGDREIRPSGIRSGAVSPSAVGATRPLSRGDSWSHSRPAPFFARTMSDLISHRGSTDGRDSVSGIHPRTGSAYSTGGGGAGGGSTGSGGGRASPTTTSSLFAAQSQIQALKDKHDAQTEALLAALADSQKTTKELREDNEALKSQVRSLEERLAETIANSKQKEKELLRATRTRPVQITERSSAISSNRYTDFPLHSHPSPQSKPPARSPSPMKRRLSTSSSIFPPIPASMSLLMAETPGSPPQSSLGSGPSPPPSPTLVLPKLAFKQKPLDRQDHDAMSLPAPQPVPISHKRSMSGASIATSANFSFETGSPGSLKLKPEHELLLGDMTRLSLVTGFGGDSEIEN